MVLLSHDESLEAAPITRQGWRTEVESRAVTRGGATNGDVTPNDLSTNTAETAIPLSGSGRLDIAITPNGNTAFITNVTNTGSNVGVFPIDLTTMTAGSASRPLGRCCERSPHRQNVT